MVRGRTTAPAGLVLGHEITGEVIEKGTDVETVAIGDLVTVPFNVACGRCRTCREQQTGVCLNVNPSAPVALYGYVDMGGWVGGQADYVMVPYADFNLLKFPDKAQAMAKIRDLTMLSDILPTGFHGALECGVEPGSNSLHTEQTPVLRYNRQLVMALLNDRLRSRRSSMPKAISRRMRRRAMPNSTRALPPNSCSIRTACWRGRPDNLGFATIGGLPVGHRSSSREPIGQAFSGARRMR